MKRLRVLAATAALIAGALTTQPAESVAAAPAPRHDARASTPSNDDFAARTPVTVGSLTLVDDVGATSQPAEPDLAALRGPGCDTVDARADCGSTVWFAFTAPASASYVIDTCDSPNDLDSYLEVFTGSTVAGLSPIVSNDDGPAVASRNCAFSSSVTLDAVAGTAYSLRLSGLSASEGTAYLGVFPAGSVPAAPTVATTLEMGTTAVPPEFIDTSTSGGRRTASFAFSSAPVGTATECSLDGTAFAPCTSPASFVVAADPSVRHVFRARAVGDPTPAVAYVTIDQTPPDTVFLAAPAEGSPTTLPATVIPSAADALEARGIANRATCTVDDINIFPCATPGGSAFTIDADLCAGSHAITARAFDHAGNSDPSPATRSFTTTANAACTSAAPSITATSATAGSTSTTVLATATVTTGGRYAEVVVELGPEAGVYDTAARQTYPPTAAATQSVTVGARVTPGTSYHYRLSVRTATGVRSSGDQVVSVPPTVTGTALQQATAGTPRPAGPSAITIPVTVTAGSPARPVVVKAFVSSAPVVLQEGYGRSADAVVSATAVGPTTVVIPLTDVQAGQVLHYRIFTIDSLAVPTPSSAKFTISPDLTFTVPATGTPPVPPLPPVVVPPTPYTLRAAQVSVKKLKHSAKKVKVTVAGLPALAQVAVSAKGKKLKAALPAATVPAPGSRTFVLKLSAKARTALAARALKKLKVVVSVTPAGGTRQQVTLTAPVT